MPFWYRRNTTGDSVQALKKFKLDPTYAATAKRWDVVKLDASGNVVKAAAGDTQVLGVLENIEIKLAAEADTYGHVRTNATAIYEVPTSGAGTPVVGEQYGITADGKVDLTNTTTTCVTVIGIPSTVIGIPSGYVEVQIHGRQLV